MYTQEQINEFKAKADKWDALDAKIGEVFAVSDDKSTKDCYDIVDIAELAAKAFGYL